MKTVTFINVIESVTLKEYLVIKCGVSTKLPIKPYFEWFILNTLNIPKMYRVSTIIMYKKMGSIPRELSLNAGKLLDVNHPLLEKYNDNYAETN